MSRHCAVAAQATATPPGRPAQEKLFVTLRPRSTIIFIAARAMFYWAGKLKHYKSCTSGVAAWF
jgi:hypothetical protein